MRLPLTQLSVGRLVLGGLALVGFAVASYLLLDRGTAAPEPPKARPQELFTKWPTEKPEVVFVLTGQMHGYLQKCGCSNPQKGGLERRFNFIESLRAKGWEVVGLDLGDLPKPLKYTPTPEQTLTKYEFAMKALKIMGYKAIGLGHEEMALPTINALAKYSIQKGNEYPRVLGTNVANLNAFPGLVDTELFATKSDLKVGVMNIVGQELVNTAPDRAITFAAGAGPVVQGTLKAWAGGPKPELRVMLYQGSLEAAQVAAKAFPDLNLIVCETPDSEAPDQPTIVNNGKTWICQVGQKGQSVGVVGVFKGKNGPEFHYQRVVMADEFETTADKEKGHPLLNLLQEYSDTVKDNDYLSEMAKRKKEHSIQAQKAGKGAAYVGADACKTCHAAEQAVWDKSKHSHAYDALEKIARHPTGRNFDGECIICHTVGYEIKTGYVNAKDTPHLKNVQCESCHGPSSLHVAEETANLKKRAKDQTHKFGLQLSPWKGADGKGMMPSLEKLEAYAKERDTVKREAHFTPAEYKTFIGTYATCANCHDIDNDPNFKLETYWKTIVHTGMSKKK